MTVASALASHDSNVANKPRLQVIDYARGLGILLVVFGHVWDGLEHRVTMPPGSFRPVFEWVYSFHMPVFFFLSGLFIYRSAQKPTAQFTVDRLSRLAWPYVLWSILQMLLQSAGGGEKISASHWPRVLAIDPTGQFWFLYVLLLISFLMLALVKIGLNQWAILAIACATFVVTRFHGQALPKTLFMSAMYFPYVALACCVSKTILALLEKMKAWQGMVLSLAGIVAITILSQRPPGHTHRFDPVTGLIGTIMTLSLARLFEMARLDFLRLLGVLSMPIYLVHIIAAGVMRTALIKAHVNHWLIHVLAGTIVGLVIPLIVHAVVRRLKIPFVFEFPVSEEKK